MRRIAVAICIVGCASRGNDTGTNNSALHTGGPLQAITYPNVLPAFWNTETATGGLTGASCGPAGGPCYDNVVTVFESTYGPDEEIGWVYQSGNNASSFPQFFGGADGIGGF